MGHKYVTQVLCSFIYQKVFWLIRIQFRPQLSM